MFGTIRRHQQWLWMVIITITIISFVAFFSPDSKMRHVAEANMGSVDGRRLTREDYLNARKEELLAYRLSQRRWPTSEEAGRGMEQQMRQRLFYVEKMRELGIEVNDLAVAHYMANVFRDRSTGAYSAKIYDEFVKELPQGGLTEDDMFRYFRHQVGLNQLVTVVGMSGKLLTPRVAETYYQRENEQTAGGVVFLVLSNYLNTVEMDAGKIGEFYTNRIGAYSTPTNMQVTYVSFEVTNFLAEADKRLALETNLNSEVDRVYSLGSTNRYKDLTEVAAKELIRKEFQHQVAFGVARSNAVQFANVVFAASPPSVSNLVVLAKQKGLVVKDSGQFGFRDEAKGFPGDDGESISEAAFKLSADQPLLGQLVSTTNAVYIVGLKNLILPRQQSLEEVRSRVSDDYRQFKGFEKMHEAGAALQKKLSEGLTNKTFQAICNEAKVTPVDLPFFNSSTPVIAGMDDRVTASQLSKVAARVPTGKVSNYVPIHDGGMVLYVRERKPPSDTAMKLAAYLEDQREGRQTAAFEEWFMKGFEKSGLAPAQPTSAGQPQ